MDKRISQRTLHLSYGIRNGRATVLSVMRRKLLVESGGQRDLIRIEPDEASSYWVGQRIDLEKLDRKYGWPERTASANQWESLLGHLPKGSILEGYVAKRLSGSILVDFGFSKLLYISADHFMRHARRQYRDGFMPEVGEQITMTYYGVHAGAGTPILYAWDYGRDPRYGLYDSGYRSHYRGEDGPFAVLPWDNKRD